MFFSIFLQSYTHTNTQSEKRLQRIQYSLELPNNHHLLALTLHSSRRNLTMMSTLCWRRACQSQRRCARQRINMVGTVIISQMVKEVFNPWWPKLRLSWRVSWGGACSLKYTANTVLYVPHICLISYFCFFFCLNKPSEIVGNLFYLLYIIFLCVTYGNNLLSFETLLGRCALYKYTRQLRSPLKGSHSLTAHGHCCLWVLLLRYTEWPTKQVWSEILKDKAEIFSKFLKVPSEIIVWSF